MTTTRPARRTSTEQAARTRLALLEESPRSLFCLTGHRSGELLTSAGRLIVHEDAAELALLIAGADPIPVPPSAGDRTPDEYVPLAALPDLDALLWPLRPDEFRVDGDGNTAPPPDRLTVPYQEAHHG